MRNFILIALTVLISAAGGFFIGQQSKSAANAQTVIAADTKKTDLLKILESENVKSFQSWEDDNGKFFGVIREIDEPSSEDADSYDHGKISIYDESGKLVFDLQDSAVRSINFARLKPNSNQVIIETNGGGTDNFLRILDYANGKFVELDASKETQLRGGWWTMPEYRTGMTGAYFKPAQLIVIKQIGGSDNSPKASIFRNKNNKFQKAGEISMQELGDFIEAQLNKKAK